MAKKNNQYPEEVQELWEKFQAEPTPENEIAFIKAENAYLKSGKGEIEEVSIAAEVAKAVAGVMSKQGMPPMRPTKAFLHKVVKCDEVIVERSEKNPGELRVIETVRTGVSINIDRIANYNRSILRQSRAKVLIPQEKKDAFLKEISKAVINANKE